MRGGGIIHSDYSIYEGSISRRGNMKDGFGIFIKLKNSTNNRLPPIPNNTSSSSSRIPPNAVLGVDNMGFHGIDADILIELANPQINNDADTPYDDNIPKEIDLSEFDSNVHLNDIVFSVKNSQPEVAIDDDAIDDDAIDDDAINDDAINDDAINDDAIDDDAINDDAIDDDVINAILKDHPEQVYNPINIQSVNVNPTTAGQLEILFTLINDPEKKNMVENLIRQNNIKHDAIDYIFVGNFNKNNFEGEGVKVYLSQNTYYSGIFKNGSYYNGTLNGVNGIYTGFFDNDTPHGFGVYTYSHVVNEVNISHTYKGRFVNGKRNGYGKTTIIKNNILISKHVGMYANDVKSGIGLVQKSNRDIYYGIFENDKMNGYGTYLTFDNSTQGLNIDNSTQGLNSIYSGNYKNDNKYGAGFQVDFEDNSMCSMYHGSFENNMKNGMGTLVQHDDYIYHGKFKNDKKNGIGTIYLVKKYRKVKDTGMKYTGIFKDDTLDTNNTRPIYYSDAYLLKKMSKIYYMQGFYNENNETVNIPKYWIIEQSKRDIYKYFGRLTRNNNTKSFIKNGPGVLINEDEGFIYVGNFTNNLPHNQGIKLYLDGTRGYMGYFYFGKYSRTGTLIQINPLEPNEDDNPTKPEFIYNGLFQNNKLNGIGTMFFLSEVFSANFVDNFPKDNVSKEYNALEKMQFDAKTVENHKRTFDEMVTPT